MAFASDSTTAPAVQTGLLPTLDRRAIGRDGWARAREIAARLGGEVRDHVAEGMRQAWAAARAMLQPSQPEDIRLADQPGVSDVVANYPNAAGAVPPLLPLPAPLPSLSAALSRRRAIFGALVDEPDTAAEARAIHTRRQLVAAAEHGVALLASLGLPRLVTPGFVPHDPEVIGAAVDIAINLLDALDGDPDAEPWLGWTGAVLGRADPGDTLDREDESELDEDDGTAEPSLASPERHPSVPVVPWGTRYTARGGEEGQLRWAEGGHHDRELDPCDGPQDDDELDDDGLSKGEGDSADDEPNLGAPDGDGDQRRWAQGPSTANDPEADDADAEPEQGAAALWVFGPSRCEVAHA